MCLQQSKNFKVIKSNFEKMEVKSTSSAKLDFFTSENLEKKYKVKLPKRFKDFVDTREYDQYNDLYVYNIYLYSADNKFKVKFNNKKLFSVFEDNGIKMPNDEGDVYIPLCMIDGPQFLAVNLSKGDTCPVSSWEHEDGMFHPHSESLDVFLKNLLKKGEKTPFELLQKAIDKAKALEEKKQYKQALKILHEAVAAKHLSLEVNANDDDGYKEAIASLFSLYASCYQETNELDKAIEHYLKAIELENSYAGLNLIELYLDKAFELKKAQEIIAKLNTPSFYLDAYSKYHVKNYAAHIYILLGNGIEATKIYKEILKTYEVEEPERIDETIKDLQKLIKENTPNINLVKDILTWFKHKEYKLSSSETTENREWWNNLDSYGKFWKQVLREACKIKGEPTDNDLAKILELEALYFEEKHKIKDSKPFEFFKNLKHLECYGQLSNLDVFKNMKTLDSITYNGKVNKNFVIESPDNKNFVSAAARGNLKEVERLLQLGVNINVKVEGNTALIKAVLNDRMKLAFYLIEHGADIYLNGIDNDTALKYCGDADRKKLEEAFKKAGGHKVESNFRKIKNARVTNACSLDDLSNYEALKLAKANGPTSDFPNSAFFKMSTDYPGHKKDTVLLDCFFYDKLLIVNEKVKLFFEKKRLRNIEILPVKIKDHAGKFISEPYYIINPFAVDCLNLEKSEPEFSVFDNSIIESVNAEAIDDVKLDKDIQLFRITNYYYGPIFFRKQLALEIEQAGFTGIKFVEPKR